MEITSLAELASKADGAFSDFAKLLIYCVLGIQTLRSIIAYSGWLKGTKFRWLVHGSEIEDLVDSSVNVTLNKLGLDERDLRALSEYKRLRGEIYFDNDKYVERLIILLSRYIHEYPEAQTYGYKTPTKSIYYLSTMDASLNEESCGEMASLLYALYISSIKNTINPHFIVTIKKGNVLLARAFANKLGVPLVLCKGKKDSSALKIEPSGIKPVNNIEGLVHLQELANDSSKQLSGLFVDCNCSGGSSLREAVKFFNDTIDSNNIKNISKLENLFMLYRADNELGKKEFVRENRDIGLNTFWYFDCNEEIKKELRELSDILHKAGYKTYDRKVKSKVTAISNMLRKEELMSLE